MNDRRPTDLELANALRVHLPVVARADLRERVATGVADTHQQRAWPSVVGALTDADPIARRRSLLLAAAALLAVALLGAVAAGAWRDWRRSDANPGAVGQFAFVRGGDVYVATADGSDAVLVAHVDGSELSNPQWSADGRYLAVQAPEPAVLVLDFRTEDLRRLSAGRLAAWSPVGATLAYYTPAGQIALFDVERGSSRILVEPPAGTDGYPGYDDTLAWSPDGRQLALSAIGAEGEPLRLVRIDASTGAMATVATSDECCAFRPSWAPDSRRIVYSIERERFGPRGSWVTDVDGTGSIEIRDPDGAAVDPVWSPDGSWIAYHVTHLMEGDVPPVYRIVLVRPDGSDRRTLVEISKDPDGRPLQLDGIVGWSDDGTVIAYTDRRCEVECERRELHLVSVADGADRVLPALADGGDVAWATPAIGLPTGLQPAPVRPDAEAAEPPAGEPAHPDARWGGLAFRNRGEGEGDCHVSVLDFPDTLAELPQPFGPSPTERPEGAPPGPGASPGPQPAAESCEFSFAPDGSAFSLTSQANQSFVIVATDGTVLAGPFAWHDNPTWSPAGDWIVTNDCDVSGNCSESGAMIMRSDGSSRRSLPGRPSWSRNEQALAVLDGSGQLLVGRGDGSELRPIGQFPLPSGWSPDGSVFVFVRDGNAWLARADGSEVRNLTGFELGGVVGVWWSPDGRWIAVLQGTTMWAFSPDGSIRHRLGSGLGPSDMGWGQEWAPAWSPDGGWLAIEHPDPAGAIGSGAMEVTLFHAGDWRAVRLENAWQPAWSRDGRHLAVVSSDDGGAYLAEVMNADGTGRTTVTSDVAYPPLAWVP